MKYLLGIAVWSALAFITARLIHAAKRKEYLLETGEALAPNEIPHGDEDATYYAIICPHCWAGERYRRTGWSHKPGQYRMCADCMARLEERLKRRAS